MKQIFHKSDSRGHANHGWLNTHHTFSFANYYNPERMHFGALRVLNDDIVTGGMGFGRHPHDNMEIISIPLEGELEHEDSMGNKFVIRKNDVQVMSAGTGIIHSEKNKNHNQPVNFLQIWVFPKEKNINPAYDQITYAPEESQNQWQLIVAPDDGKAAAINQDAYFSMAELEKGKSLDYSLIREGNGVYLFLLEGKLRLNGQVMEKRDGMGIWDVDQFTIEASEKASVLLMEVPMQLN